MRAWRLPAKFNAKPYHKAAPRSYEDVAIIHFHGPKPPLYLNFTAAGTCWEMNELCLKGFEARACRYLEAWVAHAEGADGARWRRMWNETCPPWMAQQERRAAEEAAAKEREAQERERQLRELREEHRREVAQLEQQQRGQQEQQQEQEHETLRRR